MKRENGERKVREGQSNKGLGLNKCRGGEGVSALGKDEKGYRLQGGPTIRKGEGTQKRVTR